jgi:thiamine kinase-like enzyme
MEGTTYTESEIKSILQTCLSQENLTEMCVNITGNTEKGDGYVGDIIFVHVTGKTKDSFPKDYDLVVKGTKKNLNLRNITPAKTFFRNEIYFYDTVLPAFIAFQLEKGVEDTFNCVPKYYGSFTTDDQDVLVFENLLTSGYSIWDKRTPLTRNHIDLVVDRYAKFHAISAAMKNQQTQKFDELTRPHRQLFKEFDGKFANVKMPFELAIEEICDLLKGDLDETVLSKWRSLSEQFKPILFASVKDFKGFEVVTHGDCWNNNFMFQSEVSIVFVPLRPNQNSFFQTVDSSVPSRVRILDWQISSVGSPVYDLSHLLFACISKEDLNDLDLILEQYYKSFSTYLRRLGSDPDTLYPNTVFLDEWNKYSRVGILFTSIVMKICIVDKDDVPDMLEIAEDEIFDKIFRFDVRNKTQLRDRIRPIIKYVVENGLID